VNYLRPIVATAVMMGAALSAWGQVGLVITGRGGDPIPLAVPFFAVDPGSENLAREMTAVVRYDLDFTGEFRLIPENRFPPGFAGFTSDATRIDFSAWQRSGAQFLVYAYISQEAGNVVAECRLFDIRTGEQVMGTLLRSPLVWVRDVAHQYSDEILRFLTGEAGIARTEIAFSGGPSGNKEIYVADYDGARMTQVTKHGSISIKPKFSPDGRKIAYLSFKDRYPFLYVYDRNTGVSTPLSRNVGLNASPAWSPDGQRLAVVLSKDGNTEIYLKNADGTGEQRLTNNAHGDTSPTFSPDGSRIAFVSDRLGNPQIFVMGTDGSNPQRVSFQGGSAYDPAWSPDGLRIAYVAQVRGQGLQIYVMNADGSNPTPLTQAPGNNESPSWSADSRHVIFTSTRRGRKELWTVTLSPRLETRPVPNLAIASEGPYWGPRRATEGLP
jgi:TolB protein